MPLTLSVVPREHSETRASAGNQDRFHRPPVKEDGFPRPRAPSADNVLPSSRRSRDRLGFVRARHRSPGLATGTRLPALLRPSLCSRTERLDPTTLSADSSPAGAMGHAPPVDFCNRIDLRARTEERSNPAHRTGGRPLAQLFPRVATLGPVSVAPFRERTAGARPVESSRVRGSKARARSSRMISSASHHDRSRRELCPDPIASDTSCRKHVAPQAGVSCFAEGFVSERPCRACPAPVRFRERTPLGWQPACGR